ncbi:unnamed protein product [Linum tenue]|uniref:Uncharacterized protein n=1 Tax=Linum tenue TaxID=586396 RepID=A0AAV0IHG5_9ROSI|nr:unnamed protein product [Linum tenue]
MRSSNDGNSNLDSRFSQTLKNVQGMLKGRSIPGKVLLTRRSPAEEASLQEHSPTFHRSFSENDAGTSNRTDTSKEDDVWTAKKPNSSSIANKLKPSPPSIEVSSGEVQKSSVGARATDSARVMKFTKELSGATVMLGMLILLR